MLIPKLAITLALIALVITVYPTCVFACSCLPPGPPAAALADATAVFAGRVTAVAVPADRSGTSPLQVTFAVSRSWKGADRPTISVTTPSSSASCGVDFVDGQEYLVYARASEGVLQTNLCSRTSTLAAAGDDIAALRTGSTPSPSTSGGALPPTLYAST